MFLVYHFSLNLFHFDTLKYAENGILNLELFFCLFETGIIEIFMAFPQSVFYRGSGRAVFVGLLGRKTIS